MIRRTAQLIYLPILYLLSLIYLTVIWSRNLLFSLSILRIKKLKKPVISVGNISVGGSGKTALVLELLRYLPDYCVLTRGYKSKALEKNILPVIVSVADNAVMYGDEPSLIKEKHPKHTVVIDPNRFRGATFAMLKDQNISGFLLDDGFQHRFLHRDFNILLFDMYAYKNKNSLLPLGYFREPLSALNRADYILLTKWEHLEKSFLDRAFKTLKDINPNLEFIESKIASVQNHNKLSLKDQSVCLVSGLGQPKVFEQDFKKNFSFNKVNLHFMYSDHHDFNQSELNFISSKCKEFSASIVCSEKDFIKIKRLKVDLDNVYFTTQKLILSEKFLEKLKKYT